jgi:CRP-like cAMP-binding protein
VQVPGTVLRIDRSAFLAEAGHGSGLRQVLDHYLQAYLHQISQGVACNGLHAMVERCAHWILLTHDRAGGTEFPFTHEFLSQMLGVRRTAITEAAGALQRARLVRFGGGRITILDREGLEASSCECYEITRGEFDRLLTPLAS